MAKRIRIDDAVIDITPGTPIKDIHSPVTSTKTKELGGSGKRFWAGMGLMLISIGLVFIGHQFQNTSVERWFAFIELGFGIWGFCVCEGILP